MKHWNFIFLGIFIIEQVQNVHGFLRNSFCIVITTVMTFMHIAIFINIVRLLKKNWNIFTYFRYFQIGSISTSYPFPPSLTDWPIDALTDSLTNPQDDTSSGSSHSIPCNGSRRAFVIKSKLPWKNVWDDDLNRWCMFWQKVCLFVVQSVFGVKSFLKVRKLLRNNSKKNFKQKRFKSK